MFGFKKPAQSGGFVAEAIVPDPVLPYPPVIVRQENIASIKALLADLTPQNIGRFVKDQQNFSYAPVTDSYPFGTARTAPVFAQFWDYEGMRACCKVLCRTNKDGSFTLISKAETRLLTLFAGDPATGSKPAALLSVPNPQGGVNISVTGDPNVFKGIIYLAEADATKVMTDLHAEALTVAANPCWKAPICPACPTGNEAKALAATYG